MSPRANGHGDGIAGRFQQPRLWMAHAAGSRDFEGRNLLHTRQTSSLFGNGTALARCLWGAQAL